MKPGALLQMVSVEIGLGCNLCNLHPQCPNYLRDDRYAGLPTLNHMTEDLVVDVVHAFYLCDFRGWVNFSFYNEPTLDLPKLFRIVEGVSRVAQECKLALMTNGTLLPDDVRPFKVFDWIGVTDYGDKETPHPGRLEALTALCGAGRWTPDPRGVFVATGRLDGRRRGLGPDRSERPCVYPFKDLAVDYFGNCHLCCYDWRGTAPIGNVLTESVQVCLAQWERVVTSIARTQMTPDAPESCRRCRYKKFQQLDSLNALARTHAQEWLDVHRAHD
jgi:hypothetical protein